MTVDVLSTSVLGSTDVPGGVCLGELGRTLKPFRGPEKSCGSEGETTYLYVVLNTVFMGALGEWHP